jgi:AraC-like DNA-binding protein
MAPPPLAPLPRNLLDAIAGAGFDLRALAAQADIDPQALEGGVTEIEADRFLMAAWHAIGDPSFGLRAGCQMRPERFGISGLTAMTSPTLGVAVGRKARYNRLLWGDSYELFTGSEEVTVRIAGRADARPYGRAKIDMELASLVTFARRFTGADIVPVRLRIRGPAPAPSYRAMYEDVFRCAIRFGQPEDSLTFLKTDFDRPLVSADARASYWLDVAADAALGKMGDGSMVSRVRAQLHAMLQGDSPTLGAVASALCVSDRTLQRQLAAEGSSFRQLLDDVRHDLARRALSSEGANAIELAYMLGFEDANSFYRAFRRWTGTTPEAWRAARLRSGQEHNPSPHSPAPSR